MALLGLLSQLPDIMVVASHGPIFRLVSKQRCFVAGCELGAPFEQELDYWK